MIAACWQALSQSEIALIEAGTGVGKSLAYLIPAMLFAKITGQRVLIATHTIHLQEQLLTKDIPLAAAILGLPIHAVLAKGMGNYICQKRVDSLDESQRDEKLEKSSHLEKFRHYLSSNHPHSRADLPFALPNSLWNQINAESDSCLYQSCEYFAQCGLMKARSKAANAEIIIANHHLLFADLTKRIKSNQTESSALPSYRALIVDEAHHAQDIAAHHFAACIAKDEVLAILSRLFTGFDLARPRSLGRLDAFVKILAKESTQSPSFERAYNYFKQIWESSKAELAPKIEQLFVQLKNLGCCSSENAKRGDDGKFRLGKTPEELANWENELKPTTLQLKTLVQTLIDSARDGLGQLAELFGDRLNASQSLRFLKAEITASVNRLETLCNCLDLLADFQKSDQIFWLEMKSGRVVKLFCSELNIKKELQNHLFPNLQSAIFCSATLTANQSFDFLKNQLGLLDQMNISKSIREHIYPSPFDYENQALLALPNDLPPQSHPNYLISSCKAIRAVLKCIKGNAFILFTSRETMLRCLDLLRDSLSQWDLMVQGDEPRYQLLRRFEMSKRAVLFGLNSFWEGVDVQKGALKCVIVFKLPFRPPDDPMLQARAEQLRCEGKDPFREDALPQAIITFKQGFGRLLRRKDDFGCVVCLDPRLIKSAYGKSFLKALPNCPKIIGDQGFIADAIDNFFKTKAN